MKEPLEKLQAALEQEAASCGGTVSVLLCRGEQVLFEREGARPAVSASIIKTPLMLFILEEVQKGNLSLEQTVPLPNPLPDSIAFEEGEASPSLGEALAWSIVASDNTATNALIDLAGMDRFNAWCAANGLKATRLERKMLDWEALYEGKNNFTSARDQLKLFQLLEQPDFLTAELRAFARKVLEGQRSFELALRYLPFAKAAHKGGALEGLRNDVGVFLRPEGDCFFAFFVSGCDETEAERAIGRMGRLAWNYLESVPMPFAWIREGVAPLYVNPELSAERADEALAGMRVDCLEERNGFVRIRTPYRYEGWVEKHCLCAAAPVWEQGERRLVIQGWGDVQAGTKTQTQVLFSLPRGAEVALLECREGWARIALPDGRQGWIPERFLMPMPTDWRSRPEAELRAALCREAERYLGVQYRWGGKTHLGIDCSGLCSMAYMLNGIFIHRDASIQEGFPLREIPAQTAQPGDLLFYPGHVVMLLPEKRYIHATCGGGNHRVMYNSLDPAQPDYRADLDLSKAKAATLF